MAVEILRVELFLVDVAPRQTILEEGDREWEAVRVADHYALTVAVVVAARYRLEPQIGPVDAALDRVERHCHRINHFLDVVQPASQRSVHQGSIEAPCVRLHVLRPEEESLPYIQHQIRDEGIRFDDRNVSGCRWRVDADDGPVTTRIGFDGPTDVDVTRDVVQSQTARWNLIQLVDKRRVGAQRRRPTHSFARHGVQSGIFVVEGDILDCVGRIDQLIQLARIEDGVDVVSARYQPERTSFHHFTSAVILLQLVSSHTRALVTTLGVGA